MRTRAGIAAFVICAAAAALEGQPQAPAAVAACPPECAGQTVTASNFSHQDLTNANFTGATIVGAKFLRANLTGAHFDNAKFQIIPGFPTSAPDFSFANLTSATFTGAQFQAPTYLTYATLTCADFSGTDINNGNAIFGDEPLLYDKGATCPASFQGAKMKFEGTTMNCEFIDDWKAFDLARAVVKACLTQLSDRNFSGAILDHVDLGGAVLDGDLFVGAHLIGATLIHASLQCKRGGFEPEGCVDLSFASLQGAHLDNANLTGASLYKALLANKNGSQVSDSATATQAHLKNVNLAGAQLSGVDFTLANFYGSSAANPSGCATTGGNVPSGFTKSCATAQGAIMTGTKFISSYLHGVDFTSAEMAGVNFYQAVLTGANFKTATLDVNTNDGSPTNFTRAFLQGTNLDAASSLPRGNLANAFFDFSSGNTLYVTLNGADHNAFACSERGPCKPASGLDVCLSMSFPATTVPAANGTITCPDGAPADSSGCGALPGTPGSCSLQAGGCAAVERLGSSRWRSNLAIGAPPDPGPPPGMYKSDATFTCGAPDCAICGGKGSGAALIFW